MGDDLILNTTKRQCGIDPEDTSYDIELVTHINSFLFLFQRLGIGPAEGFSLIDGTEKWSDYLGIEQIAAVRTLLGLRVRMIFDPPATGPATEAMERQASMLEWHLNIQSEEVKWDAALALYLQSTESP